MLPGAGSMDLLVNVGVFSCLSPMEGRTALFLDILVYGHKLAREIVDVAVFNGGPCEQEVCTLNLTSMEHHRGTH